jgi:hypothetical protein
VLALLVQHAPAELLVHRNTVERTPDEEADFAGHAECARILRDQLHRVDPGMIERERARVGRRIAASGGVPIQVELFSLIAICNRELAVACIERGASIRSLTRTGQSVWEWVAPGGARAVRLAVDLGADLGQLRRAGKEALSFSVAYDDADCARLLLDLGASVAVSADASEHTLVHEAASLGSARVLALLLPCAPQSIHTKRHFLEETPLEKAVAAGHTACVDVLRVHLGL